MRISFIYAALLCLPLLTTEAQATGDLSCEIDDANLKLTANTAVSRGMGGQFLNFKSEAVIKSKVVPASLQKLTLDTALIHHWFTGRDIKLSFYKETETGDHATVDITLETALPKGADEDAAFVGKYELNIFAVAPGSSEGKSTTLKGKASCFAGG